MSPRAPLTVHGVRPAVNQESDPLKFGRSPHNRRTSCPRAQEALDSRSRPPACTPWRQSGRSFGFSAARRTGGGRRPRVRHIRSSTPFGLPACPLGPGVGIAVGPMSLLSIALQLSTCRRIIPNEHRIWRGTGIRTPTFFANASPSSWSQPQPTAADPIQKGLAVPEPRIGADRGRLFRSGLQIPAAFAGETDRRVVANTLA